jgi:hypothetical protein
MLTLVSLMFLNQKMNVIVIITKKKITITFSPLLEGDTHDIPKVVAELFRYHIETSRKISFYVHG